MHVNGQPPNYWQRTGSSTHHCTIPQPRRRRRIPKPRVSPRLRRDAPPWDSPQSPRYTEGVPQPRVQQSRRTGCARHGRAAPPIFSRIPSQDQRQPRKLRHSTFLVRCSAVHFLRRRTPRWKNNPNHLYAEDVQLKPHSRVEHLFAKGHGGNTSLARRQATSNNPRLLAADNQKHPTCRLDK